MGKANLDKFKERLIQMREEIMNGDLMKSTDDLQISSDDLPDEADLANNVINQQITFSMRQRELVKLRGIEEALDRFENGEYGSCEECDEWIGDKRLLNQPFTTLCVTHAEEREREEGRFRANAY